MKRLTAFLVAVLTLVFSVPVAYAIDFDFVEIGDTIYYFDSKQNRLEIADEDHEWQPGDTIFIDLYGDNTKKSVVRNYKVFADWDYGTNLVEEMSLEYRRANYESQTWEIRLSIQDDNLHELNGQTFSFTSTLDPSHKSYIRDTLINQIKKSNNYSTAINSYKAANYHKYSSTDTDGYLYNKRYYSDDGAVQSAAGLSNVTGGYYKGSGNKSYFPDEAAVVADSSLKKAADGYVYNDIYFSDTTSRVNVLLNTVGLTALGASPGGYSQGGRYFQQGDILDVIIFLHQVASDPNNPEIYILESAKNEGMALSYSAAEIAHDPSLYVKVTDGYTLADYSHWYRTADIAIQAHGFEPVSGGYLNQGTKDYYERLTDHPEIEAASSLGYYDSSNNYYSDAQEVFDALTSGNSTYIPVSSGFYKYSNSGYTYHFDLTDGTGITRPTSTGWANLQTGELLTESKVNSDAKKRVDVAISTQASNYDSTANPVTLEVGFQYFVAIKTKYLSTVRAYDLVGEVTVAKTKSQSRNSTVHYLDLELQNERGSEIEGNLINVKSSQSIITFRDHRGKTYIEFGENGDYGFYYVDVSNQKALNLKYSISPKADFSNLYPSANIDYIEWVEAPAFNKSGELYIYADPDSYIYEFTEKGVVEVKAKYDDAHRAWMFKTKTLGSYAISDKKLNNLSQYDTSTLTNSAVEEVPASEVGTTGSGNYGSSDGYKPNPNTGK